MIYTVKSGDTLTKIAHRYGVPIHILLASNPMISDPDHIFPGQTIKVPNIEDIPDVPGAEMDRGGMHALSRAKSVINCNIRYMLGAGGMDHKHSRPSLNGLCDCSGFVCWVLGLSRKTEIPFYKRYGGWIFTDSMVDDVNSSSGIFEKMAYPEPGCIVVYGAGKRIGHVGIVAEVQNGAMKSVIHCSAGNSKRYSSAIQETSPAIFNRPDTVWGRFVG